MATERRRSRDRRSTSAGRPRSYSQLYKNDNTVPATDVAALTPAVATTPNQVAWSDEYRYVAADLRRLLLVSGTLFAVILLLGFIF